MIRDYFNPDWTEYTFGMLFMAAWQAAVLVVLSMLGSVLIHRAAIRSAIWTACVVALVAAPLISAILPHAFLAYGGQSEPLHFPSYIARPKTAQVGEHSFWTFSEGTTADGVCRAVVWIWVAGAVIAIARFAAGWINMVKLLRLTRPCRDPRVARIVGKLVLSADRVTVLEMEGLVGAICWQIHRPKFVLPADTQRLSNAELEMMIQHELVHVRRSDPGVLFLQRVIEILYWFHPLVWWAASQASRHREFVCDDMVVASGYRASDYAMCLGQLAVWYYAPVPTAPASLGMSWSQHLVLLRVKRLLQGHSSSTAMSSYRHAILAGAAGGLVLVTSVLRVEWNSIGTVGLNPAVQWTAWPPWSARTLDTVGIRVRDYPLDGHRYDPPHATRTIQINGTGSSGALIAPEGDRTETD